MSDKLYQRCVICDGSGKVKHLNCPGGKMLHVMPVGLTGQQVEKMHELLARVAKFWRRIERLEASVERHVGSGDPHYLIAVECADYAEYCELAKELVKYDTMPDGPPNQVRR